MDFEKWLSYGERLGYQGEDLQKFVAAKEREYLEREERALKRNEEKEAREEDLRREKLEEAEKGRQFELEKLRMQADIEMARLKAELEKSASKSDLDEARSRSLRPKLPKFDEQKDDMDAFLERFEKFATAQNWNQDIWAVSLSPLLTGKGLQVYSSLPATQINQYEDLKKALLRRYELTEEGFRVKFRDSKPDKGETAFQFVARISRYLNRWVHMSEITCSFDGLIDLLVREQFIQACSPDMALFLKERAPKDVEELTRLSEQYMEAHGGSIGRSSKATGSNANRAHQSPSHHNSQQHSSDKTTDGKSAKTRRCFICGGEGHIARDHAEGGKIGSKPNNQRKDSNKAALCKSPKEQRDRNVVGSRQDDRQKAARTVTEGRIQLEDSGMPVQLGYVGGQSVQVLRDTGCSTAAVRETFVRPDQMMDRELPCILIDGTERKYRLAKIDVDTPYFTGELEAMCMTNPIYDLIIGNVDGAKLTADKDWTTQPEKKRVSAVMTRAEAKKEKDAINQLSVQVKPMEFVGLNGLKQAQKEDKSLDKWREIAASKGVNQGKYRMEIKNDILYRIYTQKRGQTNVDIRQIAVPAKYREQVMSLAHESIVGGHLGIQKTIDRISTSFYWPGMTSDVTRYCQSCDVCQKTIPKGRVTKVPLGEMPLIDEPFQRVAVDLIGPIYPASESKNRYILTLVDYATRYPEAIALPKIETERVAEAMLGVFCRVGFPKEILSDRGTQFTSGLMEEVCRLVSVKQIFTTPYNPKCNGWCERMNGVLKSMLKKMCQERPKDWDRYIPAVLFAYREVPQASTGFSPFELLYGRTVRGPMQALKEIWTDEADEASDMRNTYEYVLNLRNKLEETCKIAQESLRQAQGTYKHHYDKKARDRKFQVGQKVLVLLPTDNNKLLLQWKGPFEIVEVLNRMDYKVSVGGKVKVYHANLLKLYVERTEDKTICDHPADTTTDTMASIAVIEAVDESEMGAVDDENLLELGDFDCKETFRDVQICEDLSDIKRSQVIALLEEFCDIFTDVPGTTHLEEHRIETTTDDPIRVKPYSIPYAKRQEVLAEVSKMIDMSVVEPSRSNYSAPIVMVKKKDQTNRVCIDFRRLNAVTRFDPEPMGDIENIMTKLDKDKFFSKFDLSKGYWQIPVEKKSRHLTAFTTPEGCYQFRKLPFGLVNSGATFNRMMRKMLDGSTNTDHYVDDILSHDQSWKEHMANLRDLFTRIRNAKLTVRPSKCKIGYKTLGFVGHTVGEGIVATEDDKLQKINDAQQPKTKKQVRAFLGLAGYYRKFVPNFADVARPLTELTKKGRPNEVDWGPEEELAFNHLKDLLTKAPILRLPDLSKTFVVQTDASDTGLGCALLQEHSDGLFPVAYASKKLLDRERNYSVIERECLAIVFAIRKFEMYLYGREFVLHTDHRPLVYIQKSKMESSRIMRWALFLQNYKFRIKAIKGSENVAADYLSRQY